MKKRRSLKKKRRSFGRWLLYVVLGLFVFSLLQVTLAKWLPVYWTPLMVVRAIEYRKDASFKTQSKWRPLEAISPQLALAVVASEDNRFMNHRGFDMIEIRHSIEDGRKGKRLRGASTISQQTAKNVFLLPSHSWVRKGLEVYYTEAIELIWGKRRIMEVYLNVIECGKGIYGAEAAAQAFYKKPASQLTEAQAARIAAVLPNPLKRSVTHPSAYIQKRTQQIQGLMHKVAPPVFAH